MLQALFHAWERRLAAAATDRVVRPFEWGLEWVPPNGGPLAGGPPDVLGDWVTHVMSDTDRFFTRTRQRSTRSRTRFRGGTAADVSKRA